MLKKIAALFRRLCRKPQEPPPVGVTRDDVPTLMLPIKLVARFKTERRRVG